VVQAVRLGAPGPPESEEIVSIWRVAPDQARVEQGGAGASGTFGVRKGELWWRWDPRVGAISNVENRSGGSQTGEELATLLHPHVLLCALQLAPVGEATRAGRSVLVAEATPRPDPVSSVNVGLALLEIGRGAERYRLEFDAERGIVLAAHAFTGDQPFNKLEALEVVFDEPLPESLFEFEPPPGEELRPAGSIHRVRRHLSIAEAQAAAPFTILIPREVPRGWQMRCTYFEGSERPQAPPSVAINYRSDAADEDVSISETTASGENPLDRIADWKAANAGEHPVRVRGREEIFPHAQLLMQRDGTRILMSSRTLTAEDLIGLARLLDPAPTTT